MDKHPIYKTKIHSPYGPSKTLWVHKEGAPFNSYQPLVVKVYEDRDTKPLQRWWTSGDYLTYCRNPERFPDLFEEVSQ